jgi:hypothetical protein
MKPKGVKKKLITDKNHEDHDALRQPKDAADIKTKEAMKTRDELYAADPNKPIPAELEEKIRPENAAQRIIDARDEAMKVREAEGRSVKSLERITDEKAYESTHRQLGDIHSQRKNDPVPSAVRRATRAEIDEAVNVTATRGRAIMGGLKRWGPRLGALAVILYNPAVQKILTRLSDKLFGEKEQTYEEYATELIDSMNAQRDLLKKSPKELDTIKRDASLRIQATRSLGFDPGKELTPAQFKRVNAAMEYHRKHGAFRFDARFSAGSEA